MPRDHDAAPRGVPPAFLDEITAKASTIASCDPASAGPHWGAMHKLLLKAKVDPHVIGRLVASRDVQGLDALVRAMRGEAPAEAPTSNVPPAKEIDPDTLHHAMRAFRHRLKVMRLDAESKLGVGPMSSGKKHGIDAIVPPREYPIEVWEALARDGKLRNAGQGFYALTEEAGER
ncbi:MAG: hypothetical protein U0572_15680 [Phycisphaerales bacterium]